MAKNTNLLQETIADTHYAEQNADDIEFIGSVHSLHKCTWEEFKVLADKEYDSHFGAQQVAHDLVIIFKDGTYMDRYEYDGSEGWRYHQTPYVSDDAEFKSITKLICSGEGEEIGWWSLRALNEPDEDEDENEVDTEGE